MFFWRKIIDIFIWFIPEHIKITGELVEVYSKPSNYPFFSSSDNNSLIPINEISVDIFYIKIFDMYKGENVIIEVEEKLFKEMKEKLSNLDVAITIDYKKDFTGNFYCV